MASITTTAAAQPKIGKERSAFLRDLRERFIMAALIACGLFTIATTLSIVGILATETFNFFSSTMHNAQGEETNVDIVDFFFSLRWSPLLGETKYFGIWPLIAGTAQITVIAMAFALPLGLITAIWLSEYASPRVRSIVKPVLEVIAGVPTVVFGFFALTVITPMLRFEFLMTEAIDPDTGQPLIGSDGAVIMEPFNPLNFGTYNALAAGLAVGIMCVPIVTSLSEDALRAVPRALREGAYGLGASKFETSVKVVLPASLSGVIAATLLATARAVGETMTVALAAGNMPPRLNESATTALEINQQTQTMTGYMVQIFLGDVEHGGVEYLSCYTVAATLFVITLGLTLLGGVIRRRFRQAYD